MLHALSSLRLRYLVLGSAALAGTAALATRGTAPTPAPAPVPSPAPLFQFVDLTLPAPHETAPPPPVEEVDDTADDTFTARGMRPIESPADFAMVFVVNGVAYMRLSDELTATARGRATMTKTRGPHDDTTYSVVAPVTAAAMPADLRDWANASVLVDGRCRARVVGFAEVSRVSGDPPGSEDYYYRVQEHETPGPRPRWTRDLVVAENVTLAARLDGIGDCRGQWARSTERPAVVAAKPVHDRAAEKAALADLLANTPDDETQNDWKAMGGAGLWHEHAHVEVHSFDHPATGERWVFAQAATESGGCGDPFGAKMRVYRIGRDGHVRKSDLSYGTAHIESVVDIDGDGEPELITSEDSSTAIVDLANETHQHIEVELVTWGCGC